MATITVLITLIFLIILVYVLFTLSGLIQAVQRLEKICIAQQDKINKSLYSSEKLEHKLYRSDEPPPVPHPPQPPYKVFR